MWTYIEKEEIIENCTIQECYKDEKLSMIKLFPHEGYLIRFKEDNGYTDEEGNYTQPNYLEQLITGVDANLTQYEAVNKENIIKEGNI